MAKAITAPRLGEEPVEPGVVVREADLQEVTNAAEVPATHPLRRAKGDVGWEDTPDPMWPASIDGKSPEGSVSLAGLSKPRRR